MYRVIVTGDRNWDCADLAVAILRRIKTRHPDLLIVHGNASGVDTAFESAARYLAVPTEPPPAAWDRLGPTAGPARHAEMVKLGARFAVAMHKTLTRSRGTLDCVRRCQAVRIPVYLNPDPLARKAACSLAAV